MKNPESNSNGLSRRKMLLIGAGVTAAGTVAAGIAYHREIARFVSGRTGPENRDLKWLDPRSSSMEEGAEWVEYDKDPAARSIIHRTWKMVGGLTVPKEVYDERFRSGGERLQQAYAFDTGGSVRVGIAYPEDDPSFFGETNDGESYLLGVKIGHGLKGTLGYYDIDTEAFTGLATTGMDAVPLNKFLQENDEATWA